MMSLSWVDIEALEADSTRCSICFVTSHTTPQHRTPVDAVRSVCTPCFLRKCVDAKLAGAEECIDARCACWHGAGGA